MLSRADHYLGRVGQSMNRTQNDLALGQVRTSIVLGRSAGPSVHAAPLGARLDHQIVNAAGHIWVSDWSKKGSRKSLQDGSGGVPVRHRSTVGSPLDSARDQLRRNCQWIGTVTSPGPSPNRPILRYRPSGRARRGFLQVRSPIDSDIGGFASLRVRRNPVRSRGVYRGDG